MSERRRSLFVLLIVVALIGGSIFVVLTKPTDARPGPPGRCPARLPGRADRAAADVDADAMQRVDRPDAAARQRVRRLRGRALPVRRGPDRGQPAGRRGRRARPREQVGSTAQLFFYDWEANILDEKCKTDPDQNANQPPADRRAARGGRAGVQVQGRRRRQGLGPARRRLARRRVRRPPPSRASTSSTRRPRSRSTTGRRSSHARGGARRRCTEDERANAEVIEVPAGVLVLRAERAPTGRRRKPDRWWVIQDRPGLSGTDIKNPEQSFDQTVGNEPIVTFNFTDKGREAFQAITRRVAQRGADNALGGTRSRPRSTSRSRSTTSSSRRRTSTGARTRTASTARPARRSPATSRSSPRRTWRRSSRSAPCR